MPALTTSRVAADGGVNIQTIRFYERQGLLPAPPRMSSGYRAFPVDSVARVRFIKRAQNLGFTLKEIKELLVLREHPEAACQAVQGRAEAKIIDIDRKLKSLRLIRNELAKLARACSGRRRRHDCPLLKRLNFEEARRRT